MAAINVSQLSDFDLRDKLKSLGENVGPITATTRGVLEKKLTKMLGNNSTSSPTVHSANNAQEVMNKRKSTGSIKQVKRTSTGPCLKSTPNRRFAPFSSDEEEIPRANNHKHVTDKSESKSEFVDPNDTNICITPQPYSSSNLIAQQNARNKRRSAPGSIPTISQGTSPTIPVNMTQKKSFNKNEFSDDDLISSVKDSIESKKKTPIPSDSYKYQSTPLPGYSGRQSINKYTPSSHRSSSSTNVPDMRNEIDASLTKIRKSYSTKKPSPANRYKNDEKGKENEEEVDTEFETEENVSDTHKSHSSSCGYKMVTLFLVLAILGYFLYTSPEQEIPAITSGTYEGKSVISHKSINCLFHKLSKLAGDAECGHVSNKWIHMEALLDPSFAGSCFSAEKLPAPVEVVDFLNTTFYAKYFEINEKDEIASKSSQRPLSCRISQAMNVIAFRGGIIIAIISCVIGGYFLMKKRWTNDDEEMRQILHFVERIIDTLQRHHEVCQTNKDLPPFLPIPHVRDMLIPLAKRKKMAKIWSKAVAFLNSSDSRVRVETQRIAGEDFDVWRWIGVCTPKVKKEKKATNETYLTNEQEKCWQGPAFDEIEKVVRMPIVTPTPCLKIRYMHEGSEEKDDKWVRRVENAVLEKCNVDGAQILHIYVDKSSKEGCVYVKCDSLESAGKAFRCMYGNWFDCRLVIVKFVTLARYHQRFPDALKCVEPLKSDSNIPSSLNWVAEENK